MTKFSILIPNVDGTRIKKRRLRILSGVGFEFATDPNDSAGLSASTEPNVPASVMEV